MVLEGSPVQVGEFREAIEREGRRKETVRYCHKEWTQLKVNVSKSLSGADLETFLVSFKDQQVFIVYRFPLFGCRGEDWQSTECKRDIERRLELYEQLVTALKLKSEMKKTDERHILKIEGLGNICQLLEDVMSLGK